MSEKSCDVINIIHSHLLFKVTEEVECDVTMSNILFMGKTADFKDLAIIVL